MREPAGSQHSPWAIGAHVGGRSGAAYATSVIARPVRDEFVLALTHSPEVDRYRKFLAAGMSMLRWRGETYRLEQPERQSVEAGLPAFAVPLS